MPIYATMSLNHDAKLDFLDILMIFVEHACSGLMTPNPVGMSNDSFLGRERDVRSHGHHQYHHLEHTLLQYCDVMCISWSKSK